MKCQLFTLILSTMPVLYTSCESYTDSISSVSLLSRRRRHLTFPDGSTFSVAFCSTYKALTPDQDIYSFGLNWALAYELPNETVKYEDSNRIFPPFNIRRRRSQLYHRLEAAMDSSGIDGRACVKRALCETAHRLKPQSTLVEEILRIVFSFPLERVDLYEPAEHHVYDKAHRHGLSKRNCTELYPTCMVSLVDMVFGT